MNLIRILVPILVMMVFGFTSTGQKPFRVHCASEGAKIDCVSGLMEYNGKYYLNGKSAYLFVATKEGYRTETMLIAPKDQKANKEKSFQIPDLHIFPTKSTIGKYVYGNVMKWEDPKMKYKRVYLDDIYDRNSKDGENMDHDVSEFNEQFGDLSDMLQNELYYMGLCDTSNATIQDNGGKCLLDVTIKDVVYEYSHYTAMSDSYGLNVARMHARMNFELKDAFDEVIFTRELDIASVVYLDNFKVNYILNTLQQGVMQFLEINELKEAIIAREEKANDMSQLASIPIHAPANISSSIPQYLQSTVTLFTEDGHGSGCIISNDGYIVTNHHVVVGDSVFKVILNRGDTVEAKVIRRDWKYDLALLKASVNFDFAFKINDKARVELADKVYVLGTPADITLGQTISSGIISAQRNFFGRDYYQTDARLNGGNSGGALMNESGELIGVVCSKISGLGIEGVGFVIPAKYIFERLKVDVN